MFASELFDDLKINLVIVSKIAIASIFQTLLPETFAYRIHCFRIRFFSRLTWIDKQKLLEKLIAYSNSISVIFLWLDLACSGSIQIAIA